MPNAIGRVKLGEWCDQKASGPSISGLLGCPMGALRLLIELQKRGALVLDHCFRFHVCLWV